MNKRKLLWKFIYQCRHTVIIFLFFSLIFFSIFSLYDLETEAILYSVLLCALLASAIFTVKFLRFCNQHTERENIKKNILIMTEKLPEPRTLAEKDYQEIILSLLEANHSNLTKYQNERTESIDYYTTWVHQIKTPISVMHMILQSDDSDEHRELASELFRIEQYVEMVLCYFRLNSNSSDFLFKKYDLNKIIRNTVRKFASQFIRKHISLQYEQTDLVVLTDEKWLSFIIEQILSNAIKFTESGCIIIKADENMVLSISDTGIGIAKEDIPRIFERGFTGYNGREHKKSTGLGLYLTKKAADKLSHKISVESAVGKGSVFYINLKTDELEIE